MSGYAFSVKSSSVFLVFALTALAVLVTPVEPANYGVDRTAGVERGRLASRAPTIFDPLRYPRAVGGLRSGAGMFGIQESQEYENYKLTATYYKLQDGLTTTLMLSNKVPVRSSLNRLSTA